MKISSRLAVVLAVLMALSTTSIFADWRHSNETRRHAFTAHGRVSHVERFGSGYHVFVSGARYPFLIPHAHYRPNRFRVGLIVSLAGYYNSRGYYDYYEGNDRYDDRVLRGTVQSVDHRRDAFVLRDDRTGRHVTVVTRDRRERVRRGEYVEVTGDWARRGVFEAYDVDRLDYGYRR